MVNIITESVIIFKNEKINLGDSLSVFNVLYKNIELILKSHIDATTHIKIHIKLLLPCTILNKNTHNINEITHIQYCLKSMFFIFFWLVYKVLIFWKFPLPPFLKGDLKEVVKRKVNYKTV